MDTTKKAVNRGLSQLARTIVLSIIPILISAVEMIGNDTVDLKIIVRTALISLSIAVLSGVQEYIHKKGQYTDNESLSKGITRF